MRDVLLIAALGLGVGYLFTRQGSAQAGPSSSPWARSGSPDTTWSSQWTGADGNTYSIAPDGTNYKRENGKLYWLAEDDTWMPV